MKNLTNGSFEDYIQKQENRFDNLETILDRGFQSVTLELRGIRDPLINAASGRNQVPVSAMIITQILWAGLCLLMLAHVTRMDVSISGTGATITKQGERNGSQDNKTGN